MIITAKQVMKALPTRRHNLTPDRNYWCPPVEFTLEKVAKRYAEIAKQFDLQKWETYHDCDNKAMMYKAVADGMFASEEAVDHSAEGVAVGICFYQKKDKSSYIWEKSKVSGHAINFAIVPTRCGRLELVFIEPQFAGVKTSPEIKLCKGERKSIWFCYI